MPRDPLADFKRALDAEFEVARLRGALLGIRAGREELDILSGRKATHSISAN